GGSPARDPASAQLGVLCRGHAESHRAGIMASYRSRATRAVRSGSPSRRPNYLGRFDLVSQRFSMFPLATVNGQPAGPEDLQFDAAGQLWFTEQFTGRIGRLDPTAGAVRTWPVLDTRGREADQQ